jgi:DNA-binding FadR family transcriptional regulator
MRSSSNCSAYCALGGLKLGERLPSEPELMRLTGVGRSTAREAVRMIAGMQLVEVRVGHGTFVRDGLGSS